VCDGFGALVLLGCHGYGTWDEVLRTISTSPFMGTRPKDVSTPWSSMPHHPVHQQ